MSDEKIHNGAIWEKVASMGLAEKELIASFDSESDFINYMMRKPLLDFNVTKKQLGQHVESSEKPKDIDDLKRISKTKSEEEFSDKEQKAK